MIVRIRFGRGRMIMRRTGKNGRIALLLASLLTLVSISFAAFGLWRLGKDLGYAGDFVFSTGLLSHWQVWIAAAVASEYAGWSLTQYSKRAGRDADQADDDEAPAQKVTARV